MPRDSCYTRMGIILLPSTPRPLLITKHRPPLPGLSSKPSASAVPPQGQVSFLQEVQTAPAARRTRTVAYVGLADECKAAMGSDFGSWAALGWSGGLSAGLCADGSQYIASARASDPELTPGRGNTGSWGRSKGIPDSVGAAVRLRGGVAARRVMFRPRRGQRQPLGAECSRGCRR